MPTQESFSHPGTVLPKRGLPYVPHSETSKRAAREFEGKAPTIRAMVLKALESAGESGLTDEEIFRVVREMLPGDRRGSLKDSTVRARRVELVEEKLVQDSGDARPLASGICGSVWRTKGDFR